LFKFFFAIFLSTDFVDFYLLNSETLILLEDACRLFWAYTRADGSPSVTGLQIGTFETRKPIISHCFFPDPFRFVFFPRAVAQAVGGARSSPSRRTALHSLAPRRTAVLSLAPRG
jgi:hypothetical protein